MRLIYIRMPYLVFICSLIYFLPTVYAQEPSWQWVRKAVDHPDNFYGSEDAQIVSDKTGNIYIADRFYGNQVYGTLALKPKGKESMLLAKYNSKGKILWVKDVENIANFKIDPVGNIFYIGNKIISSPKNLKHYKNQYQPYVVKLDTLGVEQWKRIMPVAWNATSLDLWLLKDGLLRLIIEKRIKIENPDKSRSQEDTIIQKSHVLVTCTAKGEFKDQVSLFSFKEYYESQQNTLVTKFFNNYLYIIGDINEDMNIGKAKFKDVYKGSFFLAKYDIKGEQKWAKQFQRDTYGSDHTTDNHMDLVTDIENNVFVAGHLIGKAVFDDIEINRKGEVDGFIVKLNENGETLWAKQIGDGNTGGYGGAPANGVTTDKFGNVYITGGFRDKLTVGKKILINRGEKKTYRDDSRFHTQSDLYVVSYNPKGEVLWAKDGGGPNYDVGLKITIDGNGNIYTIGRMFDQTAIFDDQSVSTTDWVALFVAQMNNPNYSLSNEQQNRSASKIVQKGVYSSVPKIWAVIIGVSEYENSNVTPLKYAANDAMLYYNFLKSQQGGNVPDEQIALLTNKNATRSNILKALTKTFYRSFENDVIILFLSCHGQPDPVGNEMYFMPYDADKDNPEGTGVSQIDIEKIISRSNASKKILIADACHSGGIGTEISGKKGDDNATMINKLLEQIAYSQDGTAMLSASSSSEASYEDTRFGGGHGAFSFYLVEGLSGKGDLNNDGIVNIREVYEYIYKKVVDATNGVQHPELKGNFDNNLPMSIVK